MAKKADKLRTMQVRVTFLMHTCHMYVFMYVCMKTRFCDRRVQISSSLAAGSRSMELCSPVQGNPT